MHIEMYGLQFETPTVTFYLWTPWRASYIEHRLFDAISHVPNVEIEKTPEEIRLHISDAKSWRAALQAVARVLKGWQEEAESGTERRAWRWMLEADIDCNGYDHSGERASLWGFVRLGLDHTNPGEGDKVEEIDLNDFGFRVYPKEEGRG
jgi:hypothetical protein